MEFLKDGSSIAVDWIKKELFYRTEAMTVNLHTIVEKNQFITLQDCLEKYTEEEQLGTDDTWHCPHCKQFKQAWKKFDIWRLSEILVIHLKRFLLLFIYY